MAAEFTYSKEALNKGVKQFIEEMKEGLGKQGAQMSQIPTYITAVPNGTEKVHMLRFCSATADIHRVLSLQSISAVQIFVSALSPFMETIPSP